MLMTQSLYYLSLSQVVESSQTGTSIRHKVYALTKETKLLIYTAQERQIVKTIILGN